MKQVIRIGEEPKEEKALVPIEITHMLDTYEGWSNNKDYIKLKKAEVVTYLGFCSDDGDMFMTNDEKTGHIRIYKGKLNDGVY